MESEEIKIKIDVQDILKHLEKCPECFKEFEKILWKNEELKNIKAFVEKSKLEEEKSKERYLWR